MRKSYLLLSVMIAGLLSGCTYASGPTEFATDDKYTYAEQTDVPQAESAVEWISAALKKTENDQFAQKFWYKGFVKNTILSRTTTSMFEGAVIKPDGYNVDAKIARQPYQYYRFDDKKYIRTGDYWMTAREESMPIDILAGFEDWFPFMEKATQLADEKVYGEICIPFQVKLTAAEWLATSNSPLFDPIREQLANRSDIDSILKDSIVKTTIWIGKEDRFIHQYETWIILPLPKAGHMDQQIKFSFYKYNDPGIKVKEPEDVEKYLLY